MKYTVGLLAALTLSFSVCVLNAATITFDDAVGGGNPAGTYTEAGYLFTPNSATNDVKCYDAGCLKEFKQGEITTMTKDGGGVFDLLGFYFALIGNGSDQGVQDITVTGLFENLTTISRTFSLNALLSSFIDTSVTGADDPAATAILKNDGYFVTIANGLFSNVLSVNWSTNSEGVQSASARLDNVSVSDPSPVPLPAAGWLLLAGLATMGLMQRRKAIA